MLEDDDYWNESDVGRTVKLDFFNANSFEEQEDPDPYLTTEVEPEIGAELITLNKFGLARKCLSSLSNVCVYLDYRHDQQLMTKIGIIVEKCSQKLYQNFN